MELFVFVMLGIFIVLIGIVGYVGGFKPAGFAMTFIGVVGFLIISIAFYSGYASYTYSLKHAKLPQQIALYQHDLALNNFNGMIGLLFFGAMIAFGIIMYYLGLKEEKKIGIKIEGN